MINDLGRYFLPEQEYYLDNLSYKRIETDQEIEYTLNCTDTIKADILNEEQVKVAFTRSLCFEPFNIFELSVTFASVLRFRPETKLEINWEEINLAEEFRKSGGNFLNNLTSRASLQIAQITASFGQPPIITPPGIVSDNGDEN